MTNGSIGDVDRFKANDVGSKIGKIFRCGRFQLARRTDLVSRIAGHHLVDGGRVVEQANRCVAQRADHRKPIVQLGEQWQIFRELDTGDLGRNGLEHAFDIVRDIFLGIPQVEMAGAALKVKQNNTLRFAPTPPVRQSVIGLRPQVQHRAKCHAQHARTADSQDVTTGDTQLAVT